EPRTAARGAREARRRRKGERPGPGRFSRVSSVPPSIESVTALDGIEELAAVVPQAVLQDDLHVLDVRDARSRITLHDDEARVLAGGDRSDLLLAPEEDRAVERSDADRLD